MPNNAPPRRPAVARASAPASPASSSPVSAATAPSSTPGNLPASWGAAGALLLDQARAIGANAPVNAALLDSSFHDAGTVDLSALWTLPQPVGQPQGRVAIRRLDDKGRLLLPLSLTQHSKFSAPAERDGAVTTVFLPDSPERPDPARCMAPMPLDERGRLTVNAATRTQVGWQPGTDVLVTYDPARRVLTLCAVAAIHDVLLAGLDSLRSSTSQPLA